MKIDVMRSIPKNREEFERNLNILRELAIQRKFCVPCQEKWLVQGITNVRALPNGRIDFSTVDESARSIANLVANMEPLKDDDE